MNNDFSKTSSEITKLKQAVNQYRRSFPKEPLGSDLFVPESVTVDAVRNFMEATVSAIDELNEQIQESESAAKKRHEEILASSKSSARFDLPNFICALIAALGVLVPAIAWFITHLCSNV